jgi:hypothetical protein
MFIRKKKLKEYITKLKNDNRAKSMGQNYTQPLSAEQQGKNIYLQGYEDGTDNMYNAISHKFKL